MVLAVAHAIVASCHSRFMLNFKSFLLCYRKPTFYERIHVDTVVKMVCSRPNNGFFAIGNIVKVLPYVCVYMRQVHRLGYRTFLFEV